MESPVHRPPVGTLGKWSTYVAVGIAALCLLIVVVWVWSAVIVDILAAYPSPERHEHVRVTHLAAPVSSATTRAPSVAHDFDGDGTPDRFETEYYHMEPLFSRVGNGLLRVISGADGSVLVCHATVTPIANEEWCGDFDGNGTDDVLCDDDGQWCVLARMH